MTKPTLYGADYSVYVRIARLALIEKGVDHELVPVDIFAPGGPPYWYRDLHPFGRIPAFTHAGVSLFETAAICRYVDEAFDGPALQPDTAAERAIMATVIGMLDAYAYRPLVWGIGVETASKPARGEQPNEKTVQAALPIAEICVRELNDFASRTGWLAGDCLSLADLHAAPMIGFFMRSPLAKPILARHKALLEWWARLIARSSYAATATSD